MRFLASVVLVVVVGLLGACERKSAAPGGIAEVAPVISADAITLGFKRPAVGDTWEAEETTTAELAVELGQPVPVPMTQQRIEHSRVEVLAVSGDHVTRARIAYGAISKSRTASGKTTETPSPIAGHTYTLEAGTPVKVSTETGPASEVEASAVRDAEKYFGKVDRTVLLLAGRRFVKDQPVELPAAEVLEAMQGNDGGMSSATMTVTFRRMNGDRAELDVHLGMAGEGDKGSELSVDLTGPMAIDPVSGQPMSMELTGPFTMRGKIKADGTMTMSARRTR